MTGPADRRLQPIDVYCFAGKNIDEAVASAEGAGALGLRHAPRPRLAVQEEEFHFLALDDHLERAEEWVVPNAIGFEPQSGPRIMKCLVSAAQLLKYAAEYADSGHAITVTSRCKHE